MAGYGLCFLKLRIYGGLRQLDKRTQNAQNVQGRFLGLEIHDQG